MAAFPPPGTGCSWGCPRSGGPPVILKGKRLHVIEAARIVNPQPHRQLVWHVPIEQPLMTAKWNRLREFDHAVGTGNPDIALIIVVPPESLRFAHNISNPLRVLAAYQFHDADDRAIGQRVRPKVPSAAFVSELR